MAKVGYGTEYLEKDYGFERLTIEKFEEFLRDLQEGSPYRWPNLYFAWEKPDGTLLMIGTNSTQMYHILRHERDYEHDELRKSFGLPAAMEYKTVLHSIAPYCTYVKGGESYQYIDKLVEEVSQCRYLGFWEDPDVLMDDPHGFNRVLACGRWELAKEMIGITEKDGSLLQTLAEAVDRSEHGSEAKGCAREDSLGK